MYSLSSAIAIFFLAMSFKLALLLFVLSLTILSVRCTRTCQKGQYIAADTISAAIVLQAPFKMNPPVSESILANLAQRA